MKRTLVVASLVAGVSAVYILRLDAAAGLFVDDAWYIVLAKSLAQGDGFRLISSATTAILPAFPPGFPMLLAPVLAVTPNFPDNVAALKAVSIVAMSGVAAAMYLHLVRHRSVPTLVATVVALIAALMPAFVFLATSTVMAEAVFTLGQLCVVLSVERAARAPAQDATRGAIIVSTEALFLILAQEAVRRSRAISRAVWLGETDGVDDGGGARISHMTASTAGRTSRRVSGASGPDVTGGMALRLQAVSVLAKAGVASAIVDGRKPGALAKAVAGRDAGGTRVGSR